MPWWEADFSPKSVPTLPCLLLTSKPEQGMFWASNPHLEPHLLTPPKFQMLVMSLRHFWLACYSLIIRTEECCCFCPEGSSSLLMALRMCLGVCHCSAPHMDQLLQCAVGHPGSRRLHSWQAPGPGPDHHHGSCTDLQRWVSSEHANPCVYTHPRTVCGCVHSLRCPNSILFLRIITIYSFGCARS